MNWSALRVWAAVTAATLCLCWPSAGLGSSAGSASSGHRAAADDCVAIANPGERLSCFDRLYGRPQSPTAAHSQPADEPATAAPDTTAVAPARRPPAAADTPIPPRPAGGTFGADQLPAPRQDVPPAEELVIELVDVGRRATGHQWYRLANGQIWSQVSAREVHFESGDVVRIRRGRLGTYHLRPADGAGRSTQVRREQ